MPAGAGGGRLLAASPPEPSSAARWQARIPTADITADIIRRTLPIPRTATRRTATATRQPITAMPMRLGPLSAADATGTATVIAYAEQLSPREPDPARSLPRAPALFWLQTVLEPTQD